MRLAVIIATFALSVLAAPVAEAKPIYKSNGRSVELGPESDKISDVNTREHSPLPLSMDEIEGDGTLRERGAGRTQARGAGRTQARGAGRTQARSELPDGVTLETNAGTTWVPGIGLEENDFETRAIRNEARDTETQLNDRNVINHILTTREPEPVNRINGREPEPVNRINGREPEPVNRINSREPEPVNRINGREPEPVNRINGRGIELDTQDLELRVVQGDGKHGTGRESNKRDAVAEPIFGAGSGK